MSRPPSGPNDRVMLLGGGGGGRSGGQQQRVVSGDPFGPRPGEQVAQLNTYGHSVTLGGTTSGALLSRQQQQALKSEEGAAMLLGALEKYGPAPGAKAMLNWEKSAAEHALQSGVYITWRSRKGPTDCTRVGPGARCFCGHPYEEHGGPRQDGWKKNAMKCAACPCANYSFIPRRAEEAGEWWLPRRKDFDPRTYVAKCKCGCGHADHDPRGSTHGCRACSGCKAWTSAFLCVVCDQHSEAHDTVWETAAERIADGRPVGEDYMPFAEAPQIRALVFDRKAKDLQPRPGENALGGPAARRPAIGAKPRPKVVASLSAASTRPALTSSSSTAPSAARPAPARSSASRPSAASSSSASSSLSQRFASQSFDDPPHDGYEEEEEEDPFAAHSRPPPAATRTTRPPSSSATQARPSSSTSRPAASMASRSAPSSSTRAPSATAARPAPAAAPISSAAAARAQRQAFEAQLASNVKQASSSFKPVFD